MIINVTVFLISLLWLTPGMSSDFGRHNLKMECSGKGDFVRDEPVPPQNLKEWNEHMAEGHEINTGKSLVLHPLSGVMHVEKSGKAVRIRLLQDLIVAANNRLPRKEHVEQRENGQRLAGQDFGRLRTSFTAATDRCRNALRT
jgi:hypothetical protein